MQIKKHRKNIQFPYFVISPKRSMSLITKLYYKKMHFYGFRGIVYNWFENYLTGRRQYVEIEESRSNIYQIECGVPQGSILGPLLYLIYVNDIAMSTTANVLLLMTLHYICQIVMKGNYM